MSLIVSISGIRGVVGESLTPETVVRYVSAFAEYCARLPKRSGGQGGGKIVLGRDGRATGEILANIASSTLLAMGCDVVAIGVCPTPTVQLAVEHSDAVGGIAVTASHNPMQWNGMKFIGSHGMFLDAHENKHFWDIAAKETRRYVRWEKIGKHTADNSYIQKHIDIVLGLPYINIEQIKKRKFKVVVDCINASGGVIVPELLRRLGCTLSEMNCEVSGIFVRSPEPVPENLGSLCERVREEKADLGIAVDPDVDRLVLITEKGEPFGEEYTIVSVVKYILEHKPQPANRRLTGGQVEPIVVVNLSTTRAVDDVAKKYGAKVIRTPVGEINVAKKMKEVHAIVGGEGSGGVILPAVHYGRDAVVGIGVMMQLLAEFGGTLSELKATLPQYSIVKSKMNIDAIYPDNTLLEIKNRYSNNGVVNTDDGLKIDFPDSWVHLRKSNTEPIIRIIAEAPTYTQAESLTKQFQNEITSITS